MTPLRQFRGVPTEVIRKAEGKQFVCHLSKLALKVAHLISIILALVSLLRLGKTICGFARLK